MKAFFLLKKSSLAGSSLVFCQNSRLQQLGQVLPAHLASGGSAVGRISPDGRKRETEVQIKQSAFVKWFEDEKPHRSYYCHSYE